MLVPVKWASAARVNVVCIVMASPLFHRSRGAYACRTSPPVLGSARRGDDRPELAAARRQLARRSSSVAKKSESEKRKTHLFWRSAQYARANRPSQSREGRPTDPLPRESLAPLSQHLRWIDAIFAPEELGELGRAAKPCSAAIRASDCVWPGRNVS